MRRAADQFRSAKIHPRPATRLQAGCLGRTQASRLSGVIALVAMVLTAIGAASIAPANAQDRAADTELIMVEEAGCMWCVRWLEEIGPAYGKTPEGRAAPLRRVDVHAVPKDLVHLKRANYTPTFILVSEGQEIGRIQGYPGQDFFWTMLGDLIAKLKPVGTTEAEAAR